MGKNWLNFYRWNNSRRYKAHKYEPWYDDHADYNTNAPSYYDYLARWNKHLQHITLFINRLMNRNIEVEDTNTIDLTKTGDWIDNGGCPPADYDDIIKIKGDVKVSSQTETKTLENTPVKTFELPNAIKKKSDGLWSPNYDKMLNSIDDELGNINNRTDDLQDQIDDLDDRVTINEGDISNIKGDINNIKGDIIDINKRIDGLMGVNKTRLEYGTDFTIEFFNGFYTDNDELMVEMIESSSTIEFFVSLNRNEGAILKHDDIANEALMRHTLPVADVPESRVFKVKFMGDFADFNGHRILRSDGSNNLWNLRPTSARATWNASLSVHSQADGFLYSWTSYSDGYNSQLSVYDQDLTMTQGNLNPQFTIEK